MSRRRRKAAYGAAAAAAMSEGPLGLGQRVALLPGLIRDTLNGHYEGLTRGRLAMMVVALLYIVSPVDLLPEAVLTIPGLVDDAAIATWLIASLFGATTAYQSWAGRGLGDLGAGLGSDGTASAAGATDDAGTTGSAGTAGARRSARAGATRVVPGEVVTS